MTKIKLPETIKRKPKKEVIYSQTEQQPLVYEEKRPDYFEETHVISTIEQQGQVVTKVSLPETIKRKPKKEVIYSQTEQPLVYEEKRPDYFEETHVISTIEQQGQVVTKVSLPEIQKFKPLTPIKPKEEVIYTTEKKLASEFISKELHPYIEIERIEQPKQAYDETVSIIEHQEQVLTKVKLPETIKRKPKKEILYSQIEQTPLVYEEERPEYYEDTHIISKIEQVTQPLKKTVEFKPEQQFDETLSTICQQEMVTTKLKAKKEKIYSQIKQLPYVLEEARPQLFDRVVIKCKSGMIVTQATVPAQIQKVKTLVKPKEQEIFFTESIESSVQFISKSIQPIMYEIDEEVIQTVEIITDNVIVRKDYKLPKRVTFKDVVQTDDTPKVEIFTDSLGYQTISLTKISPFVLTEINLSGSFTAVEEIVQIDKKLKIKKPKKIVTQFKTTPVISAQKSPDSYIETVTYEEVIEEEDHPYSGSLLKAQLIKKQKEIEEKEIESSKRPTSEITIRSRKLKPDLFVVELNLPLIYIIQLVPFSIPREIITESIGKEVDVKILHKSEIELKSDEYSQLSTISLAEKEEKVKKVKKVKVPIKTTETIVLEQIETDNLYTQASPKIDKQVEEEIEYTQTELTLDNLYIQKMYKKPKKVSFRIESEETPRLEIFTDTLGYERVIFTRTSPLVYTEFNLPSINEKEEEIFEEEIYPLHSKIFKAKLVKSTKDSVEKEIEEEKIRKPTSQIIVKSRKIKPGLFVVELELPLVRTAQLLVPFSVPRQIITEAVSNEVDIKIMKKPEISLKSDDYNQLSTISFDKKPELRESQASLNQESATEEFVDAFDTMPLKSQKANSSIEDLQSLNVQQVCYNELELKYAKKAIKSKKLKGLEQSRLCGSFELLEDVTLSDDVKRKLLILIY